MQKAFDISSKIFIFAFLVLVTAIFTNLTFPDDAMHTYHWAFVIFLIFYTVAMPTVLAVRRPKSL